jgi:RHS repeat-associated protein
MQARRLVRLVLLSALCALARPAFAGEYVLFYHSDALGSPQAMTDINGNVVWRADYEPFGNLADVTETLPNTREFIGKQHDPETSLHYFGARYYDGSLGRFLSVDPALFNGRPDSAVKQPQRFNIYIYGLNNPYRFRDSDGRDPIDNSGKYFIEQNIMQLVESGQLITGLASSITLGTTSLAVSSGRVASGAVKAAEAGKAADNAVDAVRLNKSLASQEQIAEKGIEIAGPKSEPFRDAQRIADVYGGRADDWIKKTSSSHTAPDGTKFETHWVENVKTGERLEFKTKLAPAGGK